MKMRTSFFVRKQEECEAIERCAPKLLGLPVTTRTNAPGDRRIAILLVILNNGEVSDNINRINLQGPSIKKQNIQNLEHESFRECSLQIGQGVGWLFQPRFTVVRTLMPIIFPVFYIFLMSPFSSRLNSAKIIILIVLFTHLIY